MLKREEEMDNPRVIRVVLRSPDGTYLAGGPEAWRYTSERDEAHVFDYERDHIAEQLGKLEREHGLALSVVPVDPRERYEVCDSCGLRVMAMRAFFDGQNYLCPDCRKKLTSGARLPDSVSPRKT